VLASFDHIEPVLDMSILLLPSPFKLKLDNSFLLSPWVVVWSWVWFMTVASGCADAVMAGSLRGQGTWAVDSRMGLLASAAARIQHARGKSYVSEMSWRQTPVCHCRGGRLNALELEGQELRVQSGRVSEQQQHCSAPSSADAAGLTTNCKIY
jgi:hypothetical protein